MRQLINDHLMRRLDRLAATDRHGIANRLQAVTQAIRMSGRTQSVIRQNMLWALMYNFGAIPAAAMGLVAPWLAAVGMSASSLVVVLNALRLTR